MRAAGMTIAVVLLGLSLTGCIFGLGVKERHEEVLTGLFDDDLGRMRKAYDDAEKARQKGEILTPDYMKEQLGFDFEAKNIQRVPGHLAFRKIFGENVYQGAITGQGMVEELLTDLEKYFAYFVPYRDIRITKDRFYFSRKDTIRKGDDLLIIFIFKENKLFYSDYRYVKIDSKDSEKAFAQGILDIIDKFGGAVKRVIDATKKD